MFAVLHRLKNSEKMKEGSLIYFPQTSPIFCISWNARQECRRMELVRGVFHQKPLQHKPRNPDLKSIQEMKKQFPFYKLIWQDGSMPLFPRFLDTICP